jgi:hypothetical protein
MRRIEANRSSNAPWIAALVVLVLVAVALLVYMFWPNEAAPSGDLTDTSAGSSPAATAPTSTSTVTTRPTTTTEPQPALPLDFDLDLAMSHMEALSVGIGVREAGSENEGAAADYVAGCLEDSGYVVDVTEVSLPNGGTSHNVRATKAGASPMVVLVSAHLDSKVPSPGANDDGSGVGIVLELARDFRDADITATIQFVFFGAEEDLDLYPGQYHAGSRQFVREMTTDERSALVGMISVDMVAYGDEFLVRNMGKSSYTLVDMLLTCASEYGLPVQPDRDPTTSDYSDHEAFEVAGYPVAWLYRQEDASCHTAGDTYEHCDPQAVRQTGEMLRGFLLDLTEADLWMLARARQLD